MALKRSDTVDPLVESTYHCWSRCVRRAFLCGFDKFTGKNFDHRKLWIVNRMKLLVGIFAIDVFAYAVMDNHLHIVIKNFPKTAFSWEPEEIATRWLMLFPKRRDDYGHAMEPTETEIAEIIENPKRVEILRKRLCDISWFMRCLNENIAKRANIEDDVTGSFWEGRFKSTRLDDDAAVLTGMVYVDLNPIRAGKAETPEESYFTSAYLRLCTKAKEKSEAKVATTISSKTEKSKNITSDYYARPKDDWLYPVEEIFKDSGISTEHYLQVLDCTGRIPVRGKIGKIPSELSPILKRTGIESSNWAESTIKFCRRFPRVAGKADKMRLAAKNAGRLWFKGLAIAATCF